MKPEIERILSEVENTSVNAMEFARIAFTKLYHNHLDAKCYSGSVMTPEGTIENHYWLECFGYIVDYRLCLSDESAPFGVFKAVDYEQYRYTGFVISMSPYTDDVLQFLTARNPLAAII